MSQKGNMCVLDSIEADANQRGICFDDSSRNYLTNLKLDYTLDRIQKTALGGGKLEFIGFDACLMSCIEISNIVKKYADILIGSQEVELAEGWNYTAVLAPFSKMNLSTAEFSQHIIDTYRDRYNSLTQDLTLSAIDLNYSSQLEDNLNKVSQTLIFGMDNQLKNSVANFIRISRHRRVCTHFEEPSYIDIGHLYSNLLKNLNRAKLNNKQNEREFKTTLNTLLNNGLEIIKQSTIAIYKGTNLSQTQGLSVYFPERRIHSSYQTLPFSKSTNWLTMIAKYILLQRTTLLKNKKGLVQQKQHA